MVVVCGAMVALDDGGGVFFGVVVELGDGDGGVVVELGDTGGGL